MLTEHTTFFARNFAQVCGDMVGAALDPRTDEAAEMSFRPEGGLVVMIHFTGPIQGEYALSMDPTTAASLVGVEWTDDPETRRDARELMVGFLKEALNATVGMTIPALKERFEGLTFLPALAVFGEIEYPDVPCARIPLDGPGTIHAYVALNMMGLELGDRLQSALQELQATVCQAAAAERNVESILRAFPSGLLSVAREGRILPGYAARSAGVAGWSPVTDLVGMDLVDYLGFESTDGLRHDVRLWLDLMWERHGMLDQYSLLELCPLQETENLRGRILHLDWVGIPDSSGGLDRLLLLVEDVTEKRRMEREMKRLAEQNAQSTELITQLVNLEPDEVTEFIYDASGLLTQAQNLVRSAQRTRSFVNSLYRTIHTLKGNSGQFQFMGLQKLASEIENQLSDLRQMDDAEALEAWAQGREGAIQGVLDEADGYVKRLEELRSKLGSREESARSKARRSEPSIMVALDEIDSLVGSIREIRDVPLLAPLKSGGDPLLRLENRCRALREIELAPFAESLGTVVNRLGERLGRKATFSLRGNARLDVEVFRSIHRCLVHLFNNAMDHGIEPPEERRAAGKLESGLVALIAESAPGRLVLRLEDDGRGVDVEAVRRRIASLPDQSEAKAAVLSETEILRFLFRGGFTTRETVGEFSGRGVGLDAVLNEIEAFGGRVEITTLPGRGTTVSLHLPLEKATPSLRHVREVP